MFKLFTNFTILEIIIKNIIFLKNILPRVKKKKLSKKRETFFVFISAATKHIEG